MDTQAILPTGVLGTEGKEPTWACLHDRAQLNLIDRDHILREHNQTWDSPLYAGHTTPYQYIRQMLQL